MGLVARLRAMVEHMPPDASVTLSVDWLRAQLVDEGDAPGMGLLTLDEVAELCGRAPGTVRTWLNTGQLDGFKLLGRSWRVRASALQEFIVRQEAGEHEPPTVRESGPVDLGAWRKHVRPDEGAA